jgi:tetratricopeptide (TPR) repeat protein
LANLLFALGKTAEADAVYEALVSVAQASRQSQSSCWSTLINSMSRAETRVRCLRIIRDNFSRMNEETRSVVFRSLYPELPTTAASLHATAPEIASDDGSNSKWAALEQLWRLNRSKFEPQSTKTLSAWLRRARNEMLEVDNLPADSLSEFALLAQGLGLSDLAFEFTSDASQTASDRDSLAKLWTMAGSLLLERGQAEAAIRYLSAVRTLDGSQQEAIIDEANALNMSGKFDEATRLSNSRWLRPMNATIGPNSWFSVAKRATEAERFELAHEFIVPTMRYSGIDEEDNRSRQSLVYIALQYSEIADGLKDPQLSADVRRSLLLSSLSPDSLSLPLSFHNSIAAKERLNRAILAAKANDMEAFERHAQVAETLQPQGIELVEDTFHELVAVGQQAVADRLFAQFESRLLVHLEKWPQDATSHNNLAWMYARCDRKLDEALQHAETAVQISPNSAVLLDTLAEVYFRRKQYSQAITAMQRCIELDPRESHLRRQLTRFLEAAIE